MFVLPVTLAPGAIAMVPAGPRPRIPARLSAVLAVGVVFVE